MVRAKLNNNGDVAETFKVHGRKVHQLAMELQTALAASRECLNGRNYQTVEDGEVKAVMDRACLDKYLKATIAMQQYGIDLFKVGEGE